MNELNLTRKIQLMIRREFPSTYVQRVSDRFLSGIPDLRVICFGLSGDIEIKLPGKGKNSDPSPIQKKILERISAAGGHCGVVRSVNDAYLFMNRLYEKGRQHNESCIRKNT